MPPVLAVIFWIWVAISVVVLLRRRIARRAERQVAEELTQDALAEADAAAPEAPMPEVEPTPAVEAQPVQPQPVHAMAAAAPAAPAFAPEPVPVVERPAPRSAPAAGIADALVGIRMPCDLVPLVFDRLATDKITLSTTGFPAEIVGSSLADEVERLGYVVRPLSDREVVATRGATELRMTIKRPDFDGRHYDHPTAREDSVVVEIVLS